MRLNVVRSIVASIISLIFVSCVTTTTSTFNNKKDLSKAEVSYIQIGYGHIQAGNSLEAKKALTKALDINKKSSGAHLGLARVYERELEFDLADSHFKKAVSYGETTEIHFQYGVYLYNRGNYLGALKEFKKTLKDTVYARRAQAFEFQGITASRVGKDELAIESYQRAIALNAAMGNSHIGLANVYKDQSNFDKAYYHYEGFVKLVRAQLVRHNATTLFLGIQLADATGDQDGLSSLSLQLRSQFEDSPEYQNYLKWKAEKDAA